VTRQDPVKNQVPSRKNYRFDFFIKKNWPGRPGNQVKTRALNRAGSKN
jgi:hypothetical protein